MINTHKPASEANQQTPRWVYFTLAALAAAVGLASSTVTAKFFVLGLERIESDPVARDLLMATGLLMVVTELMAFGMASLLPKHQLRALRTKLIACGLMLLAFETATIYITQVALNNATLATETSTETRINNIRTSIENRHAAAKSLRENGSLQSASSNAWTRTVGAGTLREALKVEQQIEPLAQELATLQATVRPSMTTILGKQAMLIYSVARAMLISIMGLVMFSAAGALIRQARNNTTPIQQSETTPTNPTTSANYAQPALAAATTNMPALRLFAIPMIALAVTPIVNGAQNQPTPAPQSQQISKATEPTRKRKVLHPTTAITLPTTKSLLSLALQPHPTAYNGKRTTARPEKGRSKKIQKTPAPFYKNLLPQK